MTNRECQFHWERGNIGEHLSDGGEYEISWAKSIDKKNSSDDFPTLISNTIQLSLDKYTWLLSANVVQEDGRLREIFSREVDATEDGNIEEIVSDFEPDAEFYYHRYLNCFKGKEIPDLAAMPKVEQPKPKEELEVEEKEDSFRPSRYHNGIYEVATVQEEVAFNVMEWLVAKGRDAKAALKTAMWVTYALKHLLRCGTKDDVFLELKKAENYIHKARTGEWLKDE